MPKKQQPHTQYVLGHAEHELERLMAQAQLYAPFTTQLLTDAGISSGMRVLDVGSGAGDVSFLAARLVGPRGHVVGVDRAPVAVDTARRRAAEQELANTRFVVGDPGDVTFEEPFDAAVGRFVIQFARDPAAMLRAVASHVRPGGVIAFQEVDWSGARALPPLPTFSRILNWGKEALQRSGADPYVGLRLAAIFAAAGLPAPALSLQTSIGSGPDHPIYAAIARLIRTLLPSIEALGVASSDEVDVDTLERRLGDEAATLSASVVWISVIGAFAQNPE